MAVAVIDGTVSGHIRIQNVHRRVGGPAGNRPGARGGVIFVLGHADQDGIALVSVQPAEGIAGLPCGAAVNTVLCAGNSGDGQRMGRTAFQRSHGRILPSLADGQGGGVVTSRQGVIGVRGENGGHMVNSGVGGSGGTLHAVRAGVGQGNGGNALNAVRPVVTLGGAGVGDSLILQHGPDRPGLAGGAGDMQHRGGQGFGQLIPLCRHKVNVDHIIAHGDRRGSNAVIAGDGHGGDAGVGLRQRIGLRVAGVLHRLIREPLKGDGGFLRGLHGGGTFQLFITGRLHRLDFDLIGGVAGQAGEGAGGLPRYAAVNGIGHAVHHFNGDGGIRHASDHRGQGLGGSSLVDGQGGVLRLQFLISALHGVADLHIVNAGIGGRLGGGTVGGAIGPGEGLHHLSASGGNIRNQRFRRPVIGVDGGLDRPSGGVLPGGADNGGGSGAFLMVAISGILSQDGIGRVRGQPLKNGAGLPRLAPINGKHRPRNGGDRNAVGSGIAGAGRGGGVLLHLRDGQRGSHRVQGSGPRLHGEADGHGVGPRVGGGGGGGLAVHGVGHGGLGNVGNGRDLISNGVSGVGIGLRLEDSGQIAGVHSGELGGELRGGGGRSVIVAVLGGFQPLVEGVGGASVQIFEHRAVLPHLPVHAVLGVLHRVQRQGIGVGCRQRGGGTGLRRFFNGIAHSSRGELGITLLHDKGDGGGVAASVHRRVGTAVRPSVIGSTLVGHGDGLDALRQSGHGQGGGLPVIGLGVIADGGGLHGAIGQIDRGGDSGDIVAGELGEPGEVQRPPNRLRQGIGVIAGTAPCDGNAGDGLGVARAALSHNGDGGGQAQLIERRPHGGGPHHFLHAENGPGNDGHGDGDTAKGRAALGNDRLDLGASGLAGIEPGIAGVNGPGVGRSIHAAAGGQPHRLDGIAHIDGIGGGENPGQGINSVIFAVLGLPDVVIVRDGRADGIGTSGHGPGDGGGGVHRQFPALHLHLTGGEGSGNGNAVHVQIGDGFAIQQTVPVIDFAVKFSGPGDGLGIDQQPLRRPQLHIVIDGAVHGDDNAIGAGSGDGHMVVQRSAHIAVESRGHVVDYRVGVPAVLHARGSGGEIGRVQGKRAQGQGGDVDLRPAPAGIAGVLDPPASGGGGLDNIRVQLRAGETAVSSRNTAVVLIGEVHHEIDGVLVRGRVVGIRRGPCGGVVICGGGKRLGGQQGHAQAERQDHAQNAGKVFRFSHRQISLS